MFSPDYLIVSNRNTQRYVAPNSPLHATVYRVNHFNNTYKTGILVIPYAYLITSPVHGVATFIRRAYTRSPYLTAVSSLTRPELYLMLWLRRPRTVPNMWYQAILGL